MNPTFALLIGVDRSDTRLDLCTLDPSASSPRLHTESTDPRPLREWFDSQRRAVPAGFAHCRGLRATRHQPHRLLQPVRRSDALSAQSRRRAQLLQKLRHLRCIHRLERCHHDRPLPGPRWGEGPHPLTITPSCDPGPCATEPSSNSNASTSRAGIWSMNARPWSIVCKPPSSSIIRRPSRCLAMTSGVRWMPTFSALAFPACPSKSPARHPPRLLAAARQPQRKTHRLPPGANLPSRVFD